MAVSRALPQNARSRSNRNVFLLATVVGIISAVLIGIVLTSQGDDPGLGTGPTAPVVVAAKEIKAGTTITAEMVEVRNVPQTTLVPGSFAAIQDLVGKIVRVDIVAGEQIPGNRVQSTTATGQVINASALSQVVPLDKPAATCEAQRCGLRAASVQVEEPVTSLGGGIRPGDRVDVIIAFRDASALTILQDVEVLALDTHIAKLTEEDLAEDEDIVSKATKPSEKEITSATLAVWPQDAQKLAAGEEFTKGSQHKLVTDGAKAAMGFAGVPDEVSFDCKGTVRLVLRHVGQQGPVDLKGAGTCARLFTYVWGQ